MLPHAPDLQEEVVREDEESHRAFKTDAFPSLQTKQTPRPAHKQLRTHRRGRRVNTLTQRIRRHDLKGGQLGE